MAEVEVRSRHPVAGRVAPTDRVLLAQAADVEAAAYRRYLEDAGLTVASVRTGSGVLEALNVNNPLLLVVDLDLPDMHGLRVLHHVRERRPTCSAVVTTADASINGAIEAIRAGAFDYLVKPFNAQRLVGAVRAALRSTHTRAIGGCEYDGENVMIGSSEKIRAVYRLIDAAASSRATVFITGESGTGKELVARQIHVRGKRRRGPFVAINCSALPKDLVESELFGHMRGAFTGAVSDHPGAVLQAQGGTLFLDEICETSMELQAKLLRFLQDGVVRRIGANTTEKADVRIVCATNRDPVREIRARRFREDLFYRLHVIPVHLPPLRERGGDLIEIARTLLTRYAGEEGRGFVRLAPCAEAAISAYAWPGNIRQLQNVLRHAIVLNEGEELTAAALPELIEFVAARSGVSGNESMTDPSGQGEEDPLPAEPARPELIKPLVQVEYEAIERAIQLCGNNISRAAAALGINPSTIYRKRRAWESGAGR